MGKDEVPEANRIYSTLSEDEKRLDVLAKARTEARLKEVCAMQTGRLEALIKARTEARLKEVCAMQTGLYDFETRAKKRNHYLKNQTIFRKAMKKYSEKENLSHFENEIMMYNTLYVFNFGYAKVQAKSKFWEFIKSLTDDNLSKVYFGFDRSLTKKLDTSAGKRGSRATILFLRNGKIVTEDKPSSVEGELRPGLGLISSVLDDDNVGLLLTDNKTEEEVLRKFRAYNKLEPKDYIKPYDTASTTLVYEKDQVLPLPHSSNAKELFPRLQKLGMTIKLSNFGRNLKMSETYVVCEKGMRVSENAVEIMKLLQVKTRSYSIEPVCRWSGLTGKTHFYE